MIKSTLLCRWQGILFILNYVNGINRVKILNHHVTYVCYKNDISDVEKNGLVTINRTEKV